MKHRFLKSFRHSSVLIIFFGIAFTFYHCGKEKGSSVSQCCSNPPLTGELGDAKFYIPNIFTPNNDGVNDFVTVFGNNFVTEIESFVIEDKNGKVLHIAEKFSPNSSQVRWDGTNSDGNIIAGIFNYEVTIRNMENESMTFTGQVCSCPCEPGTSDCRLIRLNNILNCRFGSQHDGFGRFNENLSSGEPNCE